MFSNSYIANTQKIKKTKQMKLDFLMLFYILVKKKPRLADEFDDIKKTLHSFVQSFRRNRVLHQGLENPNQFTVKIEIMR